MGILIALGLVDVYYKSPIKPSRYTWWDYRAGSWQHNKGMRIDHILVSPAVADKISTSGVLTEPRGWSKPSDHAPIYINF